MGWWGLDKKLLKSAPFPPFKTETPNLLVCTCTLPVFHAILAVPMFPFPFYRPSVFISSLCEISPSSWIIPTGEYDYYPLE